MTHPNQISINDYTYSLPEERIARFPLPERDASRLLVYNNGAIQSRFFKNISDDLPSESLLVFNDTRVVQARILFQKPTGAQIEVFILEPLGSIRDVQIAFQQKKTSSWYCLVGNAKKWKEGALSLTTQSGLKLSAQKGEALREGYVIHFSWDNEALSFADVLEEAGKTPLPPYINRKAEDDDKIRYQTVFARNSGSVAAPTAALHFTDGVLETLHQKNIRQARLTLHVGAGTFKPVSSDTMEGHHMHREQLVVNKTSMEELLAHTQKNIISVGTTSLRTLESIYWLGVKLLNAYTPPETGFSISQWEPYNNTLPSDIALPDALNAVMSYMNHHNLEAVKGETALIIMPGYRIRVADILITNFHQPKSTLLLLVAAFIGQDWRKVYDFALDNDFRFLSYGDSCLLFKNEALCFNIV